MVAKGRSSSLSQGRRWLVRRSPIDVDVSWCRSVWSRRLSSLSSVLSAAAWLRCSGSSPVSKVEFSRVEAKKGAVGRQFASVAFRGDEAASSHNDAAERIVQHTPKSERASEESRRAERGSE